MPKPVVVPIAALFLLASALVLAQAAELRTRPAIAVESPSVVATVRAYYAAVDLFLETGDMRGVRDVVDPSLLDPVESGDGGIVLFLRALRETYPLAAVDPVDISISHLMAVVQVDVEAGPAARFDSVQLVNPLRQWQMTEILTVDGSRIVGHRSSGPSLGLVASIPELPLELSLARPGKLNVVRLTFDAGGNGYVAAPAPAILIVEHGVVQIAGNGVAKVFGADGEPGEVTEPGTDVPAGPGDTIVVDAARAVLSNGSEQSAWLLAIFVFPEASDLTSREVHANTHLSKDALKNPDGRVVGDGIALKPLAIPHTSVAAGPVHITFELIVLTAGGTVELPDDALVAIAQPMFGGASIERDHLTGKVTVKNPGPGQAIVWAVIVE